MHGIGNLVGHKVIKGIDDHDQVQRHGGGERLRVSIEGFLGQSYVISINGVTVDSMVVFGRRVT